MQTNTNDPVLNIRVRLILDQLNTQAFSQTVQNMAGTVNPQMAQSIARATEQAVVNPQVKSAAQKAGNTLAREVQSAFIIGLRGGMQSAFASALGASIWGSARAAIPFAASSVALQQWFRSSLPESSRLPMVPSEVQTTGTVIGAFIDSIIAGLTSSLNTFLGSLYDLSLYGATIGPFQSFIGGMVGRYKYNIQEMADPVATYLRMSSWEYGKYQREKMLENRVLTAQTETLRRFGAQGQIGDIRLEVEKARIEAMRAIEQYNIAKKEYSDYMEATKDVYYGDKESSPEHVARQSLLSQNQQEALNKKNYAEAAYIAAQRRAADQIEQIVRQLSTAGMIMSDVINNVYRLKDAGFLIKEELPLVYKIHDTRLGLMRASKYLAGAPNSPFAQEEAALSAASFLYDTMTPERAEEFRRGLERQMVQNYREAALRSEIERKRLQSEIEGREIAMRLPSAGQNIFMRLRSDLTGAQEAIEFKGRLTEEQLEFVTQRTRQALVELTSAVVETRSKFQELSRSAGLNKFEATLNSLGSMSNLVDTISNLAGKLGPFLGNLGPLGPQMRQAKEQIDKARNDVIMAWWATIDAEKLQRQRAMRQQIFSGVGEAARGILIENMPFASMARLMELEFGKDWRKQLALRLPDDERGRAAQKDLQDLINNIAKFDELREAIARAESARSVMGFSGEALSRSTQMQTDAILDIRRQLIQLAKVIHEGVRKLPDIRFK